MSSALVLTLLGLGILAAGFLIGRYYIPDNRSLSNKAARADAYIEAVTLLANMDGDAAVDKLLEVVHDHDVGELETYFALGALFRGRGEWERAIRVHQTLALRDKKLRLRCTYELGLDYQAAGMPRRATRAMEAVVAERHRKYEERALRALCHLYEEQGRYADASDAWRKLAKRDSGAGNDEESSRRHHLLVAAAQRASDAGDWDSAKRLLRDARRGDTTSEHALVASAEMALARGNPKGALAQLEQALIAAPEYARMLVPGLVTAARELAQARLDKQAATRAKVKAEVEAEAGGADTDEDGGAAGAGGSGGDEEHADALERAACQITVEVLERVLQSLGRNGHVEMAVAELRSFYDPVRALDDYRAIAEAFPALLPARIAAARLALATGDAQDMRDELHALAAADGVLSWAMEGSWRCGTCGQRDDEFFWRCRHCRTWGSARLDVGREVLDVPPAPKKARRAIARGSVSVALLGAEAQNALPAPTLDSGASDEELALAARRPTVLGRVGSWFSGALSGLRKSEKAPRSAVAALPGRVAAADDTPPDSEPTG